MENQSTLANIRTQQNLTWKCGATCFMPESETLILRLGSIILRFYIVVNYAGCIRLESDVDGSNLLIPLCFNAIMLNIQKDKSNIN